jgi:GST-like protein
MNDDERLHVLYGYAGSGSAAVEAALRLAGLRFRMVDAASWDADSSVDELARVNPLRQIPALEWPDGSTMSESAAILAELGLRHPASGLLPSEPTRRAQALNGLVYVVTQCYTAIGVIDYPERWCTSQDAAVLKQVQAGARARLHAMWDGFADRFAPAAGEPFIGGAQPDALDLLAAVVSRWSGTRKHLKASRPEFSALLTRIEGHPVVAEVFARHWPG